MVIDNHGGGGGKVGGVVKLAAALVYSARALDAVKSVEL